MFGRKPQPESTPAVEETGKPGTKGRPTPSRKEAEAARKARVKPARTRREQNAQNRQLRAAQSAKVREGMRTGDERYLPQRDRGPVRRFTRDWVDSKFTLGEVLMPILIVALVLGFVGSPALATLGSMLTMAIVVMFVINLVVLRWPLHRQLRERFPDQAPYRGITWYAVMRSVNMRFMRMPKAQVKIGQELPKTYR